MVARFGCLLVGGLLLGSVAKAGEPVAVDRLKKFLDKNRSCYAWAVGESGGTTISDVFCILDGVVDEGTIDERTGCMVAKFDPRDGSYDMDPLGMGILSVEKPCSADLVSGFFAAESTRPFMLLLLRATTFFQVNALLVGGTEAGARALGRSLCRFVPELTGLSCDTFADVGAAKKGTTTTGTRKAGEKPAPEADTAAAPVPPWLKKKK